MIQGGDIKAGLGIFIMTIDTRGFNQRRPFAEAVVAPEFLN